MYACRVISSPPRHLASIVLILSHNASSNYQMIPTTASQLSTFNCRIFRVFILFVYLYTCWRDEDSHLRSGQPVRTVLIDTASAYTTYSRAHHMVKYPPIRRLPHDPIGDPGLLASI